MRFTVFLALLLGAACIEACTVIVAGKGATVDGSVLVSHTEDTALGAYDLRIVRVPAMDHVPGSNRSIYPSNKPGYPRFVTTERGEHYKPVDDQALTTPVGFVPQVAHTNAYFDLDYALINEFQLSMGESTCAAKTVGWSIDNPGGYNLFNINELTKIAMERCDNARCAVQTMGDLAVEHGFYNDFNGNLTHPVYMSSGESVAIGDKYGEAWIFHVLTGPNNASAVWAAQRVPDDHVSAIANGFVIRQLNLDDPDNFLASPNVHSFAKSMGWWNERRDGPFDFTAAYGYEQPTSPLLPLYVGRRLWRIFDVFAPSMNLDPHLAHHPTVPTYPFSVVPDKKISAKDVMTMMRDHYEGTQFDLTKGIDAGPFGNPNRNGGNTYGFVGGWERAISLDRTIFSFVHQVRGDLPDAVGGITWFGHSAPHGTIYLPISCAQEEIPASYMASRQSRFSTDSAWWAFQLLNNWMELRFNVIYPEVFAQISAFQDAAITIHTAAVRDALKLDSSDKMAEHMQTTFNNFAEDVVKKWWQFTWDIVSKYNGGTITTGEGPANQVPSPYPKWWIELTSFSSWPGDSYIILSNLQASKKLSDAFSLESKLPSTSASSVLVIVGLAGLGLASLFFAYKKHYTRHRVYRALD